MTFIPNFLAWIFVVLFIGLVTYFVASKLYPRSSPKVAAYAFTVGFAIARLSGQDSMFEDAFVAVGRMVGGIIGFVILWFMLFQRKVGQNG